VRTHLALLQLRYLANITYKYSARVQRPSRDLVEGYRDWVADSSSELSTHWLTSERTIEVSSQKHRRLIMPTKKLTWTATSPLTWFSLFYDRIVFLVVIDISTTVILHRWF